MAKTANVAARAEHMPTGLPGAARTIHADSAEDPYAFGMLDPVKLATLRAVIAEGSFSAAAGTLGLTQPAVSRHVAQLEQRLGTQLVRRSKRGAAPTEAGRLLAEHADAVLARLALAEAQVGELAGLRRGTVRLGSFFTALAYLSAEAAAVLESRRPALFAGGHQVIADELVDRDAAIAGLRAGELDVAVVFEHAFERAPVPDDLELVPLFDDPPRLLLPAGHALARAAEVRPRDLRGDTWIRAHQGTAARLVDHVLAAARIAPELHLAGHGDEPVEAQALVAAGRGVTVAHALNLIVDPERIAAVPLAGGRPVRHVQALVARGQRAPAPLALLEALREAGARRGRG
jgi:DNA-binding transcriptional LysR family regulator